MELPRPEQRRNRSFDVRRLLPKFFEICLGTFPRSANADGLTRNSMFKAADSRHAQRNAPDSHQIADRSCLNRRGHQWLDNRRAPALDFG
jgi:hypothetical protein